MRLVGARVGVPLEEAAGHAHLRHRDLAVPLHLADLRGDHVEQLALAGQVEVLQLAEQVGGPVEHLR
jgi:hypothetical protein